MKHKTTSDDIKNLNIRTMTIEDYEKVMDLWKHIEGFYIRSIDDSREAIMRFLARNPNTSVVALIDNAIVGSILCGHDGRCASLYHVCVRTDYRMRGIGRAMVDFALDELKKEQISSICLITFSFNKIGNVFWREIGWDIRKDVNRYELILNKKNIHTKV